MIVRSILAAGGRPLPVTEVNAYLLRVAGGQPYHRGERLSFAGAALFAGLAKGAGFDVLGACIAVLGFPTSGSEISR
jgi:hypothetical protein